jgi:protein-S-isoprenylcysteine O-methyltransferase Ste14
MTGVMSLLVRTLAGFVFLFAMMGLVIFAAAGSLGYWQGWLLIGVFAGASGVITAWLWGHDKSLLERRVQAGPTAETDPAQKVVQALASVVFLATLALPALDHRFGWSNVPAAVVLLGDGLVVLGFLVVFLVFRENTFTSGTIEIADDQRVVDTGPYGLVRHPMYAGALILFAGMPLALGSWWGLVVALAIIPVLAWRLLLEEAFLNDHLAGYQSYRSRVRFRLAPGVW